MLSSTSEQSTGSARLTLWDYIGILRRRSLVFGVTLVLIPVLAGAWSTLAADNFEAEASVLVAESAAQQALDGGASNTAVLNRLLTNEINLALGQEVTARVQAEFDGIDQDDINVSAVPGADVLSFSANRASADDAANLANAWANAYVETKRIAASASIDEAVAGLQFRLAMLGERRSEARMPLTDAEGDLSAAVTAAEVAAAERDLTRAEGSVSAQLSVLDAQIDAVANSIAELELSGELSATGSARILEAAVAPPAPTNLGLPITLALAIAVGATLGLALAIMSERLDRKIRNADDIERLGLLHLGSIPKASNTAFDPALAMVLAPHGTVASGYQTLRNTVRFLIASQGLNSIVVTSANEGEGKTSTAVNLAWGLAQGGRDVILADADLRQPRVHQVFDMERVPGLSEVATEFTPVSEVRGLFSGDYGDPLAVVSAGSPVARPGDLVVSETFSSMWIDMDWASDVIVVDSAPVLPVADTLALVQQTDAVILVARVESTRRSELAQAAAAVERVDGHLLGVVLVGDETSTVGYGRYGGTPLDNEITAVGLKRLDAVPAIDLTGNEDDNDISEIDLSELDEFELEEFDLDDDDHDEYHDDDDEDRSDHDDDDGGPAEPRSRWGVKDAEDPRGNRGSKKRRKARSGR